MIILLFPLGIVAGIVAAILGIGGGLVMVPVLNLVGATPLQATATSLVGIFLGASSATVQNFWTKNLDFKLVIYLSLSALFTTELGVRLANSLPPRYLLLGFAVFLIAAIFLIQLKRHVTPDRGKQGFWVTPLIGGITGLLSGLLGVGGGLVMVPLQMLWLGQNIKDAIRSSLGAITIISLWGVSSHGIKGNILWQEGILLGLGSTIGGQLGAKLLPKLPDRVVTQLLRGFLLIMAFYMTYKALIFNPQN
jgi:uncharacterized membrane protein YfcA